MMDYTKDEAEALAEQTVQRLRKQDEAYLDALQAAIVSIRSIYYASISHFPPLEKERIRQKHSTPLEKKLEKDLTAVILRNERYRQCLSQCLLDFEAIENELLPKDHKFARWTTVAHTMGWIKELRKEW